MAAEVRQESLWEKAVRLYEEAEAEKQEWLRRQHERMIRSNIECLTRACTTVLGIKPHEDQLVCNSDPTDQEDWEAHIDGISFAAGACKDSDTILWFPVDSLVDVGRVLAGRVSERYWQCLQQANCPDG
jgi:hypothetical protein